MTLNNTVFYMNRLLQQGDFFLHAMYYFVTYLNLIIVQKGGRDKRARNGIMVNNFLNNLLRQPNYTFIQMRVFIHFSKHPLTC